MNDNDEIKNKLIDKHEEMTLGSGIYSGYLIGPYEPDNEYSVKYLGRAAKKICSGRVDKKDIICVYSDSAFGECKSGVVLAADGIYVNTVMNKDSKFHIKYEDIDFICYDDTESEPFLKIYTKHDDCKIVDHSWFKLELLGKIIDALKKIVEEYIDDKIEW